jgi:hypothetical protein
VERISLVVSLRLAGGDVESFERAAARIVADYDGRIAPLTSSGAR